MGIKFTGMKNEHFITLGGEIKTPHTKASYETLTGLNDDTVFGRRSKKDSVEISESRANKRGYIKLSKPVFNYILTRSNGVLLGKVLGIKQDDMVDIIGFKKAWSTYNEDIVDVDELYEEEPLICGAELAKKLIDEFSIEKAIEEEVFIILCKSCVSANKVDELSDIGTITKGNGDYHLAGDYYLTVNHGLDELSVVKKKHKLSEVTDYIAKVVFRSDDSRLSYLINMKDKTNLESMIQQKIVVLPPVMRPEIQGRNDHATACYAKIIKASQDLRLTLSTGLTLEEKIAKYKALDTAVMRFQYKSDPKDTKVKSILEQMKGKKGRIRKTNLGKRQDYSGRSAVIINPYLSIRHIELPEKMIPKLFRYHIMKNVDDKQIFNLIATGNDAESLKIVKEKGLLEKIPVMMGRQPTLWKHGIQAFYAKPTKSKGIGVPALVCPAFNMDFDGDTAHLKVPLSEGAIDEVKNLILSIQNLYLPKTGECTICPRQDMLYGLHMCTRSDYALGESVGTFNNIMSVRDAVIRHKVKVYDTVTINGVKQIAGYLAFLSCFPNKMIEKESLEVKEINSKTIGGYVDLLLPKGVDTFVDAIDSMVELGFKIARIYSPSMSLLFEFNTDTQKAKDYMNAFNVFHEKMDLIDYYYDIGMEDTMSYNMAFDTEFKLVEETMTKGIGDVLGKENGYWLLSKSGARGNASNLAQIFAYKGRIAKSSTESFNAIIERNLITQLNPQEHFITSYGGRKGQIDKSLKTGDTGYAMRQMWHGTQALVIVTDDCGTKKGLTITKSDISKYITSDKDDVNKVFYKMIRGRYEADTGMYITKDKADKYTQSLNSLTIRSPITCECPCCRKCYGDDPSINDNPAIGLPVGFIAAQSIGETGSQLTMKQFQKGGVAGKGDVTSNFDRLNNYIHCSNLAELAKKGKCSTYDPVAWDTGEVHITSCDILNQSISIGDNPYKRIIPKNVPIKHDAVKGEGLCLQRGDYSINEVEKYAGVERAQLYLMYALYNIYKSECEILSVHFEVLISGMTRHCVLQTDRDDLKIGQYYSTTDLLRWDLSNTKYHTRLIGVKKIPLLADSALANIIFENIGYGLSKSVLLGTEESLEDPLQRMAMGLPPKLGTYYHNFVKERKRR